MTVNGSLTWTGGTMSGTGTTKVTGTLSLGASGETGDSETLAARTLINESSGVWYGADTLTQEADSTFLNDSASSLEIQGGGTWGSDETTDPSGTFENLGTVTVADGSASTLMRVDFINGATVDVSSGTLHLGDGGFCTSNSGSIKAGFNVAWARLSCSGTTSTTRRIPSTPART